METDDWTDRTAPDLDMIEAMALAARDTLPEPFRTPASLVRLQIADWPPEEMLDEMRIEDAYNLTGLYDGIPMTEKSVTDMPDRPDTIWLFRRPILDEWAGRGDVGLGDLVAHVLIHEFAHHFGWSDADIARIDRWWE